MSAAPHHAVSETDQHTIHRIEAFSDIVIGFCLAQIGFSLTMPKSGTDFTGVWFNADSFLFAFYFVVVLWWFHHRIFSTYFVLNRVTLVLNFTVLGSLVLTMYFLQVVVHTVALGHDDPAPFMRLFSYSFALVYTLLGSMLAVGLFIRRNELSEKDVTWGVQRLSNIVVMVLFFTVIGATAAGHNHTFGFETNGWESIALFVAGGIAVSRFIVPLLLKRVFAAKK